MKDYHHILGVAVGANQAEIRAKYRKLAKEFHPDKNRGSREAIRKFRDIQEAYEALMEMSDDSKAELDEYVLRQIERFQSLALARKTEIKRAANGAPYRAPSGSWHQLSNTKNEAQVYSFPSGRMTSASEIADSEQIAKKFISKISSMIRSVREANEELSDLRMRELARKTNRIPESEIGNRN